MRTILVRAFGGPEVLRVEEVSAPTPGASEVLVRVRAAGVNPVDAYVRTGTYARKPDLPYTPGTDGAGEVEAVGGDVKGFKVGDRVYIAGDNAVGHLQPGDVRREGHLPTDAAAPASRPRDVRSGRGHRRAVRHGVSVALHPRGGQGRRDGARARRDRRRRHRRGRARARSRHDRDRDRRERPRARRPCASTARTWPSATRTPPTWTP